MEAPSYDLREEDVESTRARYPGDNAGVTTLEDPVSKKPQVSEPPSDEERRGLDDGTADAEPTRNEVETDNEGDGSSESGSGEATRKETREVETTGPLRPEELEEIAGGETVVGARRELSRGPEAADWTPQLGEVPKSPISVVYAIGDLHGWAPALITYLVNNGLAKIEVNGVQLYKTGRDGKMSVDTNKMDLVFPHPQEYFKQNGTFPRGVFRDFGVDEMIVHNEGIHSVRAEWVAPDNVALVQIGDIFDRGDYSELATEILRQLVIQAPFRVFVLTGNHEQFLLENDLATWLMNEQRFSHLSLHGDKAFHTRFHEKTYGWRVADEDTIRREVFDRYRISATLLYLTQYAAMVRAGEAAGVRLPSTGRNTLDLDKILNGGWDAYRYAWEIASDGRFSKGATFPGAIVLLGLGHALFVHADPLAFNKVDIGGVKDSLSRVKLPGGTDLVFLFYDTGSKGGQSSRHVSLLWSRGAEEGSTAEIPRPRAAEAAHNIISVFPGTRHYVHGHSPTPITKTFMGLSPNCPITYLARNADEIVDAERGSIRVHVIDEGITPVYRAGVADVYDPALEPVGLRVHPDLVGFQDADSTRVETDSSHWLRLIDSTDFPEFTVPERLALLEPTKIGRFSPGMSVWSDETAHPEDPRHRFTMPWPRIKTTHRWYHSSPQEPLGSTAAFLIYPTTAKGFSRPERLYILSKRVNVSVDEVLFDFGVESTLAWLTDRDVSRPLALPEDQKGEDWLKNIHRPEKVLKDYLGVLSNEGPGALLTQVGMVFALLTIGKDGRLAVFVANGSDRDIYVGVRHLNSEDGGERGIFRVDRYSWNLRISDRSLGEDPAVFLALGDGERDLDPPREILKTALSDLAASEIKRGLLQVRGAACLLWFGGRLDRVVVRSDTSGILASPMAETMVLSSSTRERASAAQSDSAARTPEKAADASRIADDRRPLKSHRDVAQAHRPQGQVRPGEPRAQPPRRASPERDSELQAALARGKQHLRGPTGGALRHAPPPPLGKKGSTGHVPSRAVPSGSSHDGHRGKMVSPPKSSPGVGEAIVRGARKGVGRVFGAIKSIGEGGGKVQKIVLRLERPAKRILPVEIGVTVDAEVLSRFDVRAHHVDPSTRFLFHVERGAIHITNLSGETMIVDGKKLKTGRSTPVKVGTRFVVGRATFSVHTLPKVKDKMGGGGRGLGGHG